MTPEEADAKHEWAGMDGYTAWRLIECKAMTQDEAREMMHAWLRANQGMNTGNDANS